MKLTLGFSPCPNDTFIFDALVNKRIDTEGLDFDVVLEDVQSLNEGAKTNRLDVTKLSFPALFDNCENYAVLHAGAALGKGVGPLLIAKTVVNLPDVSHCTIAIPGEATTANFLLSFAFPVTPKRVAYLFSDIEAAVLDGRADLGVIIHENRFTYQQKGLIKVVDLGEVWEEKQKAPIPLGCIAVRRSLPPDVQQTVDRLIRKSLEVSRSHYPALTSYVTAHAQEMDEQVMRQHIELYVNDYSLDLGAEGKRAISKLYEVYNSLKGNAPGHSEDLFIGRSSV
jgi:1,4-dihydroxy-6-naphthoate synthase